jgi:hypothetical protein
MLLVRSVLKLGVDAFMFVAFIMSFNYLVYLKKTALKMMDDGLELSPRNKVVINYTIFLWAINGVSSLISIVLFSLYHSSLVDEDSPNIEEWDEAYKICFRTFTWSVNFLTSLGLLYLFYF